MKVFFYDRLRALEIIGKHVEVQAYQENINIEVRTLADTVAELGRRASLRCWWC